MAAPARRRRRLGIGVVLTVGWLLVVWLVVRSLSGWADGDDGSGAAPAEDPGVVHVHGLGVDPADGTLYAATHTGVFAVPERGRATRVADRFQDTMGFTVVGPGRFLGSGHPDLREMRGEGLPSLLGLIASDDAGATWRPVSRGGESDFHVLVAAHERVYGYDSTNQQLLVSADQRAWDARATVLLGSFAVDPDDPEHLVGVVGDGTATSVDGGRTWQPLPGAPALSLVTWQPGAGLWGASADGAVWGASTDGASWARRGQVGGRPEALLATDSVLYAAAEGAGILESADRGVTWSVRYAEEAPGLSS